MKDHVRILVCGDEKVGKSSFIGTLVARHFPQEVPAVITDVHLPPEENDDDVFCTIVDCSALLQDRQQLLEKVQSAESIVVLYDVQRPETLAHLDTFWLPLIEANTKEVPVVIVRNKVDALVAEGGVGERSSADLRRQMAPLQERFKFFHMSLECSSVSQMGITQVFHHALSAALYPVAPLYDVKADRLRPNFDRAMRRIFRVYDVDRDGLLSDNELNAFQFTSYQLYLSEEDISALKKILEKLAVLGMQDEASLVRHASGGCQGGITVEGFVRLMRLFIEKKQMKAPWKALHSHCYDDTLHLSLPPEVADPPPGKIGNSSHDQVISPSAESFLRQLFDQFATDAEAYPTKVLTEEGQAEVFSVIPDPTCAPWDTPRSREEFEAQDESELFGQLRRAPGAGQALTMKEWMSHWQMLAMNSPPLARAHLFYVGYKGHGEDMLVARVHGPRAHRRQEQNRTALQVFVLGGRGCGKSGVIKGLRLGEDLVSSKPPPSTRVVDPEEQQEDPAVEQDATAEQVEGSAASASARADEGWEMVADAEVPETCAAFATPEVRGDRGDHGAGGSSSDEQAASSSSSCRSLSVGVTEVPETFADAFLEDQAWRCDLAMLVFDPSSRESLEFISPLMADIPAAVPRLVVSCETSRGVNPSVVAAAQDMCEELELLPVLMTNPATGEGLDGDGGLRQKIAAGTFPGMLPYAERHRKAKDRNRKLRTAALVAALGIAVATGLYVISKEEASYPAKARGVGGGGASGWEAGVGGALHAPVLAAKRAAAVAAGYWRRWRAGGPGTQGGEGLVYGGRAYRSTVAATVSGRSV